MKHADQGHRDEVLRLGQALEAAGIGEFEWDAAGDSFMVSPRMAAMMGLRAGAMPAMGGEVLNRHVHPDDLALVREAQGRHRVVGGGYQYEFRHLRPDNGAEVWVRVAGVLSLGPDGRPYRAVGIVEDVTERKREESQRLTLMAELDHRVKNVLATVQALAVQTARRTTSLDV
ncbi:MAG TPA: PAS domain-containing protein, partial [Phenylobacterium sp.]